MTETVSVLPLGGCLLHGPLNPLARAATRMRYPEYGPVPGVYTFAEMVQVVEVLRGQREVPPMIRPLCSMRPGFRPVPRAADFADVDVALIEPSSPIDLTFRGYSINRTSLAHIVTNPIRATSREAARYVSLWFRTGLMGLNRKVQADAAEELVSLIPPDMEHPDLAAAVIRETRSERSDVFEGFRRMQRLIGRPIGIVVYVFQYLEDGRAISWPAGFHEEIAATARQLQLPVFEPAKIVNRYGVRAALRADLRHYNESFTQVMADALIDFAMFAAGHPVAEAAGA